MGHENNHSLPRSRQEYSVRVLLVSYIFFLPGFLPFGPLECQRVPLAFIETEIRIPSDASPVKLESLDVEFRSDVFKEV